MVNASITKWNEKKNKLTKLIAQVDKMRSQCEEISNYMYPTAQYMDGIVVDNKTFDNGVLNQSYDNYESIYNSLEKVKKYANNEITRLNNLISEEQRRLQQEAAASNNQSSGSGSNSSSGYNSNTTNTKSNPKQRYNEALY